MTVIKIVCISNCHGSRYLYYMNKLLQYKSMHSTKVLYVYNADHIDKDLTQDVKDFVKDADIFIMQRINGSINDRPYIHHDVLQQLQKKETCKIIIIPYITRVNLYWPYDESILAYKIKSSDEFNTIDIPDTDAVKSLDDAFNNINKMCQGCTISLYDFIKNNYLKIQLFKNLSDPNPPIFLQGAIEILRNTNLNYVHDDTYVNDIMNNDYWGHSIPQMPILPCIKKKFGLDFNVTQNITCKTNNTLIVYDAIDYYSITDSVRKNKGTQNDIYQYLKSQHVTGDNITP